MLLRGNYKAGSSRGGYVQVAPLPASIKTAKIRTRAMSPAEDLRSRRPTRRAKTPPSVQRTLIQTVRQKFGRLGYAEAEERKWGRTLLCQQPAPLAETAVPAVGHHATERTSDDIEQPEERHPVARLAHSPPKLLLVPGEENRVDDEGGAEGGEVGRGEHQGRYAGEVLELRSEGLRDRRGGRRRVA